MSPFLADGFVAINVTGTTDRQTSIAGAERAAQRNKANPAAPATPDRYVISCTPLTATISHRTTFTDPVTKLPGYSRSVHFLEKQGNTWKAVSNTGSAVTDQQSSCTWSRTGTTQRCGTMPTGRNGPTSFASDISSRTGGIESKSEAVASARSSKMTYRLLEPSELQARVEGDVVVVTGVNHARGKDETGKAFENRIRFTGTFIKRDGRWQVWATQGTVIQ